MAFREVPVFEVREVLRLWLAGWAIRAIARSLKPDRKTVGRIVDISKGFGLEQSADPGVLDDVFVGRVMASMVQDRPDRHGDSWTVLAGLEDRIGVWVKAGVPAVKQAELLARERVVVPERTLNRFIADRFGARPESTVLLADGDPGVELQVDFGELGFMFDEESGKRRKVWALVFTAVFSRHTFVWLSFDQKIDTVIAGFEEAWGFFGGVFAVVIPDNMKTAVIKADPLDPVLNQTFIEYAQSRGFLVDAARVRSPKDKARVERAVQFVQTSFWPGEDFGCLTEAQTAVRLWCESRAGLRVHRSTQAQPAVVFAEHELPVLKPVPESRYEVPIYRSAKVHRDHHIEVAKALYSVPGDLIGSRVDVTATTKLVKVFARGQLIKCHPRQKPGSRITDPNDLPSTKTAYAMRDIDSQRARAFKLGDHIGAFADIVLDNPLPWTRMRHVYALFRAVERYGPGRLELACERAVDAGCDNVKIVVGMVERALEAEQDLNDPIPDNVITGRFARDPEHFASGKGNAQ